MSFYHELSDDFYSLQERSNLVEEESSSHSHFYPGGETDPLHPDFGLLPIIELQNEKRIKIRLLPSFADKRLPFLLLAKHKWPPFSSNRLKVEAVCPGKTHPILLARGGANRECPVCKLRLGRRDFAIIYVLIAGHGAALSLELTPSNFGILRWMNKDGCFDLENGRQVILRKENWSLDYELLDKDSIDQDAFNKALNSGHLHVRQWDIRYDKLNSMAQACSGWVSADYPEPEVGQSRELMGLLPHCTLVKIPWGMKGPQDIGWHKTPYKMMLDSEYCSTLDDGNIGLLCGRSGNSLENGPNQNPIVIGLDADTDDFANEMLTLNPWLNDTFRVEGNRGVKWFFKISGDERCLQSTKIKRRGGKDAIDTEVGDWLSDGKQGVILGLHPSGKLYKRNRKALAQVKLCDFRLPDDCYLASLEAGDTEPSAKHEPSERRSNEAVHTKLKIEEGNLENALQTSKGLQAACPACREEGKDSDGDNLLIYDNRSFSCARFIGEKSEAKKEHYRAILRLLGKGDQKFDDSGEEQGGGHGC